MLAQSPAASAHGVQVAVLIHTAGAVNAARPFDRNTVGVVDPQDDPVVVVVVELHEVEPAVAVDVRRQTNRLQSFRLSEGASATWV
jgi:hypothetical protein